MAVGDVTGVVMDEEINNAQIVDSDASTVDDAIAEIESGKSIFQLFGSIKKAFLGCITTSKLANNLATTLAGFALDARQGKVLGDKVDALNTNLTNLNNLRVNRGVYTSNLNDIPLVTNTMTVYRAAQTCANAPVTEFGIVETMFIDSNNFAIQRFTSLVTIRFYIRCKLDGVWSSWVEK